jgi:hypothetical protein
MPTYQAEIHDIMQVLYDIANFPNIVGAIDGTHVLLMNIGNSQLQRA